MTNVDTISKKTELRKRERDGIIAFENHLKELPNSVIGDSDLCPLKHTFSDGLYIRQISIPAGVCLVGKIHFHQHPVFLMEGQIYVVTEFGKELLKAPYYFITPPGVKRAAFAATNTVWVTVHKNLSNTQNLEELEKMIIAKDFNQFDNYIKKINKHSIVKKISATIKKYFI